jgi:prophage regulatory protein
MLYADAAVGLFTKPVKLGPRASGWPESEVSALQAARIAGKTPDQIRELVRELQDRRTAETA